MTVPTLNEVRNTPDAGLISHIENLLEQAKSGELRGVLQLVFWDDGTTGSGWWLAGKHYTYIASIIGQLHITATRLSNQDMGIMQDIHELKEILDA